MYNHFKCTLGIQKLKKVSLYAGQRRTVSAIHILGLQQAYIMVKR
jgi:hypothetical protein